jgi:signal transduction histidine kinase
MAEAMALTDSTLEQMHWIAHGLRPPALDAVGLNPTLEGFCRDFARLTQLSIEYEGMELPPLPGTINISFYRFMQEALTNVAKHARASRICVMLQRDGNTLILSVEDDGLGFDAPNWQSTLQRPAGIGLLGLQERLELLGGHLEIASRPGQGTRLVARVPLPELETMPS